MTQVQLIPATGSVQTRREYLMTDALGSTHRIVSEAGVIVPEGKQAFATFGERANADDRSTLSEAQQANFNALLPRGYTGHQQADEVGVIHMNGRIYDPRLGRFLQADSLIEDIFDPQAINSYSYVRNNPMNATDPTGHWRAKEQGILRQVAAIVIMVVTGVDIRAALSVGCPGPALAAALATEAAVAGAASGALTTGTLKGTLLGALSAFTFHQIGIATLSQGERIFAHGLAGGTLEVLGGGKFGHGFVSAGLSKALSPLADTGNVAVDGAINAAIGGTVSEITGGDFANGAVMAATQYAFNALAAGALAQPTTTAIPDPNGVVEGGPWTPRTGDRPGTFDGPKLLKGPRLTLQYVPPHGSGGPPGSVGYFKTKLPSGSWQRYNLQGISITAEQAHPNLIGSGVSGAGRILGAAAPIFDIFLIYSMNKACVAAGGVLDFRSEYAGRGPDLIGSEDMIWYCYLPRGDA